MDEPLWNLFCYFLLFLFYCLLFCFKDKVPNSFGTENNVITVKSSDFEVFEALGIDNAATGHQADDAMLRNSQRLIYFHNFFSLCWN